MAKRTSTITKVGKREVELSNLEKVLFPEDEISKAQVIEYYYQARADDSRAFERPAALGGAVPGWDRRRIVLPKGSSEMGAGMDRAQESLARRRRIT